MINVNKMLENSILNALNDGLFYDSVHLNR